LKARLVLIRGGGDVGSGVAHKLFSHGMRVVITELEKPTVIRRMVSFAEAVYQGEMGIGGIYAKKVKDSKKALKTLKEGKIPVLVDPEGEAIKELKPDVLVDARMAKKNLGTKITDAPIVIGLGPGFTAGKDVHATIETKPGPNLGRVIYRGQAGKHTGMPVAIMGYSVERVLKAPVDGIFRSDKKIGDQIEKGEIVGWVDQHPIVSQISGVLQGLLHSGLKVKGNKKVGEIDPRGVREYAFALFDRSITIGNGVLNAILILEKRAFKK